MFKNLTVKLACLFAATMLWMRAASQEQVEETVSLPLRFEALPDTLLVRSGTAPSRIRVRVRTSRLQRLADDLIPGGAGEVVVDLSQARPPVYRDRIAVEHVRSPGEAVSIVSPLLELGVHRVARMTRPVRLVVEDQLPEGFVLAEPPTLTPAEVEVVGPRSLVSGLTHINTEAVSMGRRRRSFRETVALASPDPDLSLRPVEVEAMFAVDEYIDRSFPSVPISVLSDVDSTRVYVEPTSAQVRVRGPARRVGALTAADVSLVLSVGDLAPGVHQLEPQVVLPGEIRSAGVDPPSFQVIVERAEPDGAGGRP